MSASNTQSRFLRRFDDVWTRMRRVQLLKSVSLGALIWLLGFTALVVSDYLFEPGPSARLLGLTTVCALAGLYTVRSLFGSVFSWTAPNTAAEIERSFPELGQSVRTAIQYGRMDESQVESQGVANSLAAALQQRTDRQTLPLDLPAIVRTGSLTAAIAGLCFLLGGLLTGSLLDWEWQTAVRRAFLADVPYTTLNVEPGSLTVAEGLAVSLQVAVDGRTDRSVLLQSRILNDDDSSWVTQNLAAGEITESRKNHDTYAVTVNDVRQPFEYRFSAGSITSDVFRVDVRFPLRIESIAAELTPPAYTGLPVSTVEGGDISAIEGSAGRLQIVLDREPRAASLILTTTGRDQADDTSTQIPLQIDGTTLTCDLPLHDSVTYSVIAEAADGTTLPDNRHRIRIRRDQAPRVWFDEPSPDLEVHTLAEILLRIRTTDDFGLSNAGIVFEINNEQEHRLAYEDFAAALSELKSAESADHDSPGISPQTKAVLERVLPLEFFELTQRDSVTYYAFAADNRPGNSQRTETDLRFIDIRPFRRQYQVIDPDDMPAGGPNDERVMFLDELIGRQRVLLNRTIRVAGDDAVPDTSTIDRLVEEQQIIADGTVRLADFLVSRNIGGEELLFEAQSVMLTAIDSLSVAEFDNAVIQEKDAVRLLVEGRETLRLLLLKNPRAARAALQAFSRQQTQKLRRPKSDEEELAELVRRLKQLQSGEQRVVSLLGANGSSKGPRGAAAQAGGNPTDADDGAVEQDSPAATSDEAAATEATPEKTDPDQPGTFGEADGDATNEGSRAEEESPAERRQQAEERQHDIALEARDIEAKMQTLDQLTDLARDRMTAAAETAEEAAGALSRGDTDAAATLAEQAEAQFGELAEHVASLLADEIAERIARARDIASRLAQQQQQLNRQIQNQFGNGGMGSPPTTARQSTQAAGQASDSGKQSDDSDEQEGREALEGQAERLAQSALTLQDLLNAIASADRAQDQDAAAGVGRLMDELKTDDLIRDVQNLPETLATDSRAEIQVKIDDLSERLELTSQQLGQLHRLIVSPRIERLMQAERRAAGLLRKLNELNTTSDIAGWHRDARELLDDLERSGFGGPAADELEDVLRVGGWGLNENTIQANWAIGDGGTFRPPSNYVTTTTDVVKDLQAGIQELVLGDLLSDGDESTPPEYERLVERYYQVLSAGGE
ncbi:MAG: hypothetical protein R3C19_12020 [Planctomycetaceae bacterium]